MTPGGHIRAGKMNPLSQSGRTTLGGRLLQLKPAIAEGVTQTFLERHPEWLLKYGDRARKFGIEDAQFHLDFLRGAVEAGSIPAFEDYCEWAAGLLQSRGIASHFRTLRRLQIQNKRAAPHRFNQRRMGAAHFRGVDVRETMGAELAISFAIDRAWDHHSRIARVAYPADVILRVRRVADQRKLQRSVHTLECLSHFQGMILRLQPADVEEIASRFKP